MLIHGINPIFESLRSDCRPVKLYLQTGKDNKRINHLRRQAENLSIPIEAHPDLTRLCGRGSVHQGVAGEYPDDFARQLTDLPETVDRLVVFDGIRDPHNFGAALRACEVFGFRHIVYHEGNSSGLTPVAAKSSSGAIFHLNLYIANLNKAMKFLQAREFAVYALEARGDATIYDLELADRFALVIGSEGEGIRFNIRNAATSLVSIPMVGKVNSLNVSCALTAALTEFARRLG